MEPIAVEVKSDRVGLGWQDMIQAHRRKREERRLAKMKQNQAEMDPEKYRCAVIELLIVAIDMKLIFQMLYRYGYCGYFVRYIHEVLILYYMKNFA